MYPSPSDASTPLWAAAMFSNLENIEFPVSATSHKSQLGSLVSDVKGLLHGLVPISRKKKRCSHCKRCARAKAKDRFWRWRRQALPVALVVCCWRRSSNKAPRLVSDISEPVHWKWKKKKVD